MENTAVQKEYDFDEMKNLSELARLCGDYGIAAGDGNLDQAGFEYVELFKLWGSEDKNGPLLNEDNEGYFIQFAEERLQEAKANGVKSLRDLIDKLYEKRNNHIEKGSVLLQLTITHQEIDRIRKLEADAEGRIVENDIVELKKALLKIEEFLKSDKKSITIEIDFWTECIDAFDDIVDMFAIQYNDEKSQPEHCLRTFVKK